MTASCELDTDPKKRTGRFASLGVFARLEENRDLADVRWPLDGVAEARPGFEGEATGIRRRNRAARSSMTANRTTACRRRSL
jgi:hypothetical protein